MEKATLIMASLILFSVGAARAEVILESEGGIPVEASPSPQAPPLLLAQSLPGMRDRPNTESVERLPGMASAGTQLATLPKPIISDLFNYPNPFDTRKDGMEGQTQITYQLAENAPVSLEIYDLFGKKVRGWDLAAGTNGGRQGVNTIAWDGSNGAGQKVSKGGYIAQLVIEGAETTVTVVRKIGVIH